MTEILRLINGSKLYGLATPESDNDFVAVFVERPETVFSMNQIKSKPLHDRPSGTKTEAGDVDGISYSVRHFFSLALAGNPTLLGLLFAPEWAVVNSTGEGVALLENAEYFVSKKAGPRFYGYMNNQLDRMQGTKTGHIPNRPELVAKYGYDTKYASQIARLALHGIEYFSAGRISSPMGPKSIELCMTIKNGELKYDKCMDLLRKLEDKMGEAIENSTLPDEPQYDKVWQLSEAIHRNSWMNNGRT